ncbi:MAG: AAA family ATPase [Verrucomicrobiaceae bacterium]|nr:AAA family ATPase [Verrucomicrobiaceae bacterium]
MKDAFEYESLAQIDEFHRKPFAKRLAKIISAQPPGECLTVAIVSEWGAGKSSVISWILDEFAASSKEEAILPCVPVKDFNPWGCTGELALLFRLFESIARALDDELLTSWETLKTKALKLISPLASVATGIAESNGASGVGSAATGVVGLLTSFLQTDMEALRQRIKEKLVKSNRRLVVVIDDIDRLDRTELMLLFRILKVNASLPNTTFLLALDDQKVSSTIGAQFQQHDDAGRDYLEKIIQVSIALPAIPTHLMRRFVLGTIYDSIESAVDFDKDRLERIFDVLFLLRFNTPRRAKNLANAIRFSSGLVPGEVNITDLVLLECARQLFPTLYERIKNGWQYLDPSNGFSIPEMFEKPKEGTPPYQSWLVEAWTKEGGSAPTPRELRALAEWFPQSASIGYGMAATKTWWKEKRLCAQPYHWRYFSSAIVDGDVADSEVQSWIDRFKDSNSIEIESTLSPLRRDFGGHLFAEKLLRCDISADIVSAIVVFLSKADTKDNTESDEGGWVGLCANLVVAHLDHEGALELAAKVIDEAPLIWANKFIRALPSELLERKSQHQGGSPQSVLRVMASKMFQRLHDGAPIATEVAVDFIWTIWHFGNDVGLRNLLEHRLSTEPEFAYVVLASVCGRGVGEKAPRIWHWNGADSLRSLENLVHIGKFRSVVEDLARVRGDLSPTTDSRHRYLAPEELSGVFLESVRQ